jgi:type IV secretory pathway VirB2 component (pilin)
MMGNMNKMSTYNREHRLTKTLFSLIVVALALACQPIYNAFAAEIDALCDAAGWSTGIGQGIASLAVVLLGFGAMLGKVSWMQALMVAVGIVIFFNYGDIVELVSTGSGCS